ncbi:TPA: glycosyl transferase [Patescibacteria group bacterium]|nr:glycosyl transferase [Patescibacteria group bacterium]
MKLVVFSICLNEEKTIGELLERIPQNIEGIDEIVKMVIDDGSKDNTVNIAKEHGAIVFSNTQQKRLAYSFQRAIDEALRVGADIAVNIDGDLQFKPEEIPNLVKPIVKSKADFVAGNRFSNGKRPENMSLGKYYGNQLGAYVVSRLTHQEFFDVTCGFRAYSREAMLQMNINSKYTYTQESFQLMASKNLNIVQIPISIKYFKGRKSRVVTSIFSFITLSAFNIMRAFRDFAPIKFFGILGLIPFLIGILCILFMGIFFLKTGDFTPYKFVGFTGLYLVTLGMVIALFGLISDMIGRMVNNQEKILYFEKKNYYSRIKGGK